MSVSYVKTKAYRIRILNLIIFCFLPNVSYPRDYTTNLQFSSHTKQSCDTDFIMERWEHNNMSDNVYGENRTIIVRTSGFIVVFPISFSIHLYYTLLYSQDQCMRNTNITSKIYSILSYVQIILVYLRIRVEQINYTWIGKVFIAIR